MKPGSPTHGVEVITGDEFSVLLHQGKLVRLEVISTSRSDTTLRVVDEKKRDGNKQGLVKIVRGQPATVPGHPSVSIGFGWLTGPVRLAEGMNTNRVRLNLHGESIVSVKKPEQHAAQPVAKAAPTQRPAATIAASSAAHPATV